jgi:hypothetical protein
MSACLALMRCQLRVTPFLPGGRRRNPLSTIHTRGNPRPVGFGQQRCVNGVFLLEGVAWYGAFRSTWSVMGNRRRAQQLWVIIVSSVRHCYHFFSFWACFCCCPNIFLVSNYCIGVVAILI